MMIQSVGQLWAAISAKVPPCPLGSLAVWAWLGFVLFCQTAYPLQQLQNRWMFNSFGFLDFCISMLGKVKPVQCSSVEQCESHRSPSRKKEPGSSILFCILLFFNISILPFCLTKAIQGGCQKEHSNTDNIQHWKRHQENTERKPHQVLKMKAGRKSKTRLEKKSLLVRKVW